MKPNHHYAVHMPEQLHDFGPVYKFWTFLTEQLNKVLKLYNSNSWKRSQLEVLMMYAFGCKACINTMVWISFPTVLSLKSTILL
jgi:hypothetical protein